MKFSPRKKLQWNDTYEMQGNLLTSDISGGCSTVQNLERQTSDYSNNVQVIW